MSIFDSIADWFKTDERKEAEKREEINAALEAEKELAAKLEELDRQYRDGLPSEPEYDLDELFPKDLGLEKVDYTPETDEQIADRANSEAAYGKAEDTNKINKKYGESTGKLNTAAEEAERTLRESYANLEKLYSDLKKEAAADTLKRGMARSSVAVGRQSDLDAAHVAAAGEAEAGYNAAVAAIDTELARLDAERSAALNELDLKYAAQIDERVAELKKERDAAAEKYAKYNNSVIEKEQKYAVQREKDIADFLREREEDRLKREEEVREYEKKYGYSGEKRQNYAKRYDLAYDFYTSLSPDIAADALAASPNMRYYLGNYYDKLMNTLNGSSQKRYY